MAITSTNANQNALIRSEIWPDIIREELEEELYSSSLVNWVTADFPDGDQLTIPTLASLSAGNYTENTDIEVQDPTVGEFTLAITEYRQAGIAITDKMKEDAYYMEVLNTKFPQQVIRALLERLENDIFLLHKEQTTNDANTINGQAHRFDATGTSQAITLKDIAQAKLSLDKANVPKNGRMAIVDPKVSYQLVQIDNVIRQDVYGPNAALKEGFGGTKYIGRYLGFDFFESNMLDESTDLDHDTGGSDIANMFLGDEALIGAVRTTPAIEYARDWQKKRDIYHAVMRYGLGLYRPEALVTVLTK